MQCPMCAEAIPDASVRCPTCGTDLCPRPDRPVSVVVAILCTALLLVARAANAAIQIQEVLATPAYLVPFAASLGLGGLILLGLWNGHRLAWQWGRLVSVLGFILFGIITAMTFSRPAELHPLISLLFFFHCAPLLVLFLALGRQSSREYFRLRCPTCGTMTTQSADFLFSRARCRACNGIW